VLLSISACAATAWAAVVSVKVAAQGAIDVANIATTVGRCRFTVWKPELKTRLVSAPEPEM